MDRRDFLRQGLILGTATATTHGLLIASTEDISRYAGPVHLAHPADFRFVLAGTVLYTKKGEPVGVVDRLLTTQTIQVTGVKTFVAHAL